MTVTDDDLDLAEQIASALERIDARLARLEAKLAEYEPLIALVKSKADRAKRWPKFSTGGNDA